MSLFLRLDRNTAGRDFVVGDIHGCFHLLRQAMAEAGFNEGRDRLLSVGDLVDRGPHSDDALEWLAKPWFYAVRGNHEQMVIDAETVGVDPGLHCVNGALWFYQLTDVERRQFALEFADLPYAIEVDTPDGVIGLVHAEVPGDDWAAFRDALTAAEDSRPANFDHIERFALWGRDLIRGRSSFAGVAGVDRVYVGHTPVADWQILGNVHYIDTGAVFGKRLTLACITDGRIVQVSA